MSKKAKLLQRLCKSPPPTDFTWEELLAVMRSAGFIEHCSGGSHYIFEHVSKRRIVISKTHPSGLLKRYQIEAAIDSLTQVGAMKEIEQ